MELEIELLLSRHQIGKDEGGGESGVGDKRGYH